MECVAPGEYLVAFYSGGSTLTNSLICPLDGFKSHLVQWPQSRTVIPHFQVCGAVGRRQGITKKKSTTDTSTLNSLVDTPTAIVPMAPAD